MKNLGEQRKRLSFSPPTWTKKKKKKKDDELVSNSRRRNHLRNEILVITYLRGEQILLTLRRKNENSQEN